MSESPESSPTIAFFLPNLGGGGAERNILRLAGGLIRAGHSVAVIVGSSAGPNRAWVPPGAILIDLQVHRMVKALLPLARLLRRQPPRVLVSALDEASVVALAARALARATVPIVVSVRIAQSASEAQARGFRARFALPWLVRLAYPRADRIVAVSEGAAADLRQAMGLAQDRVLAIPNPVLDDRIDRLGAEPITHPWLDRIGNAPLVLAVGRLAPQKDYGHLLNAFVQVKSAVPDARLAILGEGPEKSRIEARIAELGLGDAVVLAGFQANPYGWMRRADVLALSSRFEGLPTVLIEGLACGARIVSTDCPTGPSEILAGGRWGSLVPLGDVNGFAVAVIEALRQRRWPAPPAEALAPYTEGPVVEAFENVLRPLIAVRPRAS